MSETLSAHNANDKYAEIAYNGPARTARIWQFPRITLGLLEGSEDAAVRLLYAFAQVLVYGLLLNQDMRRLDVGVDEAGAVEPDLILKGDKILRASKLRNFLLRSSALQVRATAVM